MLIMGRGMIGYDEKWKELIAEASKLKELLQKDITKYDDELIKLGEKPGNVSSEDSSAFGRALFKLQQYLPRALDGFKWFFSILSYAESRAKFERNKIKEQKEALKKRLAKLNEAELRNDMFNMRLVIDEAKAFRDGSEEKREKYNKRLDNFFAKANEYPLHYAATQGDELIIKWLIARGDDLSKKNKHQNTPLHIAVSDGYYGVAELLCNMQTLDDVDEDGNNALHIAVVREDVDMVCLLLNRSSDTIINIQNYSHSVTALYLAVAHNNFEITKMLLDAGADLEVQSNYGYTALDAAVFKKNPKIVKLLLDRGAKCPAGTELDMARNKSVDEVCKILTTPMHVGSGELEPSPQSAQVDSKLDEKKQDLQQDLANVEGNKP